jgi:hypothetical protein
LWLGIQGFGSYPVSFTKAWIADATAADLSELQRGEVMKGG